VDCPLCRKKEEFSVLYEQNFEPARLFEVSSPGGGKVLPHYRIVKCSKCGVIYSNPILSAELMHDIYYEGDFLVAQPYVLETDNINKAYSRLLRKAIRLVPSKKRLLDIGCGNGFFLLRCLEEGFKEVYGVEPSKAALAQTPQDLRGRIRNDVFRPSDFTEESFDIVCCFHVLGHVVDPNIFLAGIHTCLKKGGIVLALTHNINSWLSAIAGESWSPIYMAHISFFNKETLRKIFEKNGFAVHSVFETPNTFSAGHWVLRSPLPAPLKKLAGSVLSTLHLNSLRLTLRIGNIGIIGQRPFS